MLEEIKSLKSQISKQTENELAQIAQKYSFQNDIAQSRPASEIPRYNIPRNFTGNDQRVPNEFDSYLPPKIYKKPGSFRQNRPSTTNFNRQRRCMKCGDFSCNFRSCKAKNQRCNICNTLGHFAAVCTRVRR